MLVRTSGQDANSAHEPRGVSERERRLTCPQPTPDLDCDCVCILPTLKPALMCHSHSCHKPCFSHGSAAKNKTYETIHIFYCKVFQKRDIKLSLWSFCIIKYDLRKYILFISLRSKYVLKFVLQLKNRVIQMLVFFTSTSSESI